MFSKENPDKTKLLGFIVQDNKKSILPFLSNPLLGVLSRKAIKVTPAAAR
jgi:hypothetical protein